MTYENRPYHKKYEGRDNVNEAIALMISKIENDIDCVDYLYEFMCSKTYENIHKNRKNHKPTEQEVQKWHTDFIKETEYKMVNAKETIGEDDMYYTAYGFKDSYRRYVFASYTDSWMHYKKITPKRFTDVLSKEDFYSIAISFGYHGAHIDNFIEKMEKELGKKVTCFDRKKSTSN